MLVGLLWAHEGFESTARSDLGGERRKAVCYEGLRRRRIVDGARVERDWEVVDGGGGGGGFRL